MKVGKTNNLHRRSRQIGISIELSTASLTEAGALRLETELRQFVLAQGGVRYRNTIDWFTFDAQIYALLCEYFIAQHMPELSNTLSPDEEITLYRRRYIQLLTDEYRRERDEARRQLQAAKLETEMLRQELSKCLDDQFLPLCRQLGRLEAQVEWLEERKRQTDIQETD